MNTPLTKEQVEKLPARSATFSGFTATSDGENRRERRLRIINDRMEFNHRAVTQGRINFRVRQQQRFGVIPVLTLVSYRDFMLLNKFRSTLEKKERTKLKEWFEMFNYTTLKQQAAAIRNRSAEIFSFFKLKAKRSGKQ